MGYSPLNAFKLTLLNTRAHILFYAPIRKLFSYIRRQVSHFPDEVTGVVGSMSRSL